MACNLEHTEQIIRLYERAAAANRGLPLRAGNVVEISAAEADDVMITADLHGNQANFRSVLEIAALEEHPRRHLILQEVCHGGPCYPDGGCQSHAMLEHVARLKAEYPGRVHFILSNHELAELTDFPILKGNRLLNIVFRCGMQAAHGDAMERVRAAQLEFLRSCPLGARLPGGIFVSHSLPAEFDAHEFDLSVFERPLTENDYREYGSIFNLVWGRDYRPANAQAFAEAVGARLLIHGHDPCPQGYKAPNPLQIILDCCGTPASYLIVPTGEELSHAQLLKRIRFLPPSLHAR
jgi:hypothetical protein